MQLTKSFPPADDLISELMKIDYHKHFHTFMDAVETACIFVAALYTVLRDKWIEHNCTERLHLFVLTVIEGAKSFYTWIQNVFVPECQNLYQDLRKVYTYLRTV